MKNLYDIAKFIYSSIDKNKNKMLYLKGNNMFEITITKKNKIKKWKNGDFVIIDEDKIF